MGHRITAAVLALALLAACADGGEQASGSSGGGSDGGGDATPPDDTSDAATPDADVDDASAPGRYEAPCTASDASVECEYTLTELTTTAGTRNIYWTKPIGAPPAEGFPVALVFQGSFFGPSFTWQELTPELPFGGFYQGLLHVALLEAGFVVIEPEAEGGIAWQTNAGGDYLAGSDHALILELLDRLATSDDFGPIDVSRLYATGISSGGYMTSRMAVSYPGKFRALAIQSGSYATCLGPLCEIPSELPADHPPTLFLHGDADGTVPVGTAIAYRDALEAQGIETDMIIDMGIGHSWLERAPEAVTQWFLKH